ncbi:MAG: hypothetical protein J5521_00250 [Lachnospiraceae bacterium]|nr:hypothetical protein [Lachnospiraceae bacterium]
MRKFILISILMLASVAMGSIVEPNPSKIFIMLDASGMCLPTSDFTWENLDVKKNLSNGDDSYVYCYSYSMTKTPYEAVEELFVGNNSVFNKATNNWFANTTNPKVVAQRKSGKKLDDLKKTNPDLVPFKFVIVSEGVAGLAVREYIQSSRYKGEIEKVLFFNTPHEGTGFADQVLLNGSKDLNKIKSVSDYTTFIPLILTAYLVGGVGEMQEILISLVKEAVIGIAQDPGSAANVVNSILDKSKNYKSSMFYLAQDADFSDDVYKELLKKGNLEKTAKENIGNLQLLNVMPKMNSFVHPDYNIVYSYGLPTLGNGRRTLADFANQQKNHISKEKLESAFKTAVTDAAKEYGIPTSEDEIQKIAGDALNGIASSELKDFAGKLSTAYGEYGGDVIGYAKDISTLSKLKYNRENIAGSIWTIVSTLSKYLPDEYKNELFSTFIDEYSSDISQLVSDVKEVSEKLKAGKSMLAGSLSNYSLNFFDDGTFEVPSYSALGKNVLAFKEASVGRIGYSLNDYVKKNSLNYKGIKEYVDLVEDVGELENLRKDIDIGLTAGCLVANALTPAAEKACKAAQFATNVALITDMNLKMKEAIKNMGNLEQTKYIALKKSVDKNEHTEKFFGYRNNEYTVSYSDMEKMLFNTPHVSIATVINETEGGAKKIIPLVFSRSTGDNDIDSYASLKAWLKSDEKPLAMYDLDEIDEVDSKHDMRAFTFKNVDYINGRRNVCYYSYKPIYTMGVIEEFRFQIDDFQPDRLNSIKIDFNTKVQFVFEHSNEKDWKVYVGVNDKYEYNEKLKESPVKENGLFIFRPKDFAEKAGIGLPGGVEEDGPNIVNVFVTNRIGQKSHHKFTFFWQATDPLIQENWPKSYATISKLDTVRAYVNNIGYPFTVTKSMLSLEGLDGKIKVDNIPVAVTPKGSESFHLTAILCDALKNVHVADGEYLIKWNIEIQPEGSGPQTQYLTTIVYLDTSSPQFVLDVPTKAISLNKSNVSIGVIDSLDDKYLRGLRSFLVQRKTSDVVNLLHKSHTAENSHLIRWNGSDVNWNGWADLYVQAYDFANPNSHVTDLLLGVAKDSAKSSWKTVLDDNGEFIDGINGNTIHKAVLIDNIAPQLVNEKISYKSNHVEAPQFNRKLNGSKIVLNSMDTLLISFDINEDLLERSSTDVLVDIVLEDNTNECKKIYTSSFSVTSSTKHFEYVEPEANRINDGIYSLSVVLTDEAGNVSTKKIDGEIRVDRTAPAISSIALGGVAFKKMQDLEPAKAFINQLSDDVRNRSDLTCYTKVVINDEVAGWNEIKTLETDSKNGRESAYTFDYKKYVDVSKDGFWYVYLGCYDDAGNFSKNVNFFGMGKRYPKITYPNDDVNELLFGQVLIKGFAPNPIIDGNDNLGEFKITWKKIDDDDSKWTQDGITNLVYDLKTSTSDRDLAIWNVENFDVGEYVIKLSVRGCKEKNCEWVSTEKKVYIDDFGELPSYKPEIQIDCPKHHVAGKDQSIFIELENAPDTADWLVKAFIEAPSASNADVYVRALETTFDPMSVCPYTKAPSSGEKGLFVWKEKDAAGEEFWNVQWIGPAEGVVVDSSTMKRLSPQLKLDYTVADIDFDGKNTTSSTSDKLLSYTVESMKVGDVVSPAYNAVKTWDLGGSDVKIRFKATSGFIVDASSVNGKFEKVFNIDFSKYKAEIVWNGLINKLYPSGELAKINVIAYDKKNPSIVVSKSETWNLSFDATEIEISENSLKNYYIDFLEQTDENTTFATASYGFQFGLKGRSAYVTVEIQDDAGKCIKTLMNNSFVLAGSSNKANSLSWDGSTENGFVATKVGNYRVHVSAKDEKGKEVASKDLPFRLDIAGNVLEASKDDSKNGTPAVLIMDEAVEDPKDVWRYTGRPDYLLKADVTAQVLKDDDRSFTYQWRIDNGTQYPYVYKKNRPSLGIHRNRNKFEVAVVTLLATKGHDFSFWCKEESSGYLYTATLSRETFSNDADVSKEIVKKLKMGNSQTVIGYDAGGRGHEYRIYLKVVVFPISAYKDLLVQFPNGMNVGVVSSDLNWDDVWNKNYKSDKVGQFIYDSYTHWGKVPLWEHEIKNFKKSSGDFTFANRDLPNSCNPKNSKNYVCGSVGDKKKNDYDVHKNMLTMEVYPTDRDKGYGSGRYSGKCNNRGSTTNLDVSVKLTVNPEYWNPVLGKYKWGYNNLANRYVRFDPTNSSLYGSGYLSKVSQDHHYDGNRWGKTDVSEGITVFETLSLPMEKRVENPLLFPEEIDNLSSNHSKSLYKWRFFTDVEVKGVNYMAVAAVGANSKKFMSTSQEGEEEYDVFEGYNTLPLDIEFRVAPAVKIEEAVNSNMEAIIPSLKKVEYPYEGKNKISAPDGYVSYGENSFVSHIHKGWNEWNDKDWDDFIVSNENGFIRNPLTDSKYKIGLTSKTAEDVVKNLKDRNKLDKNIYVEGADRIKWNESSERWEYGFSYDDFDQDSHLDKGPTGDRSLMISPSSWNSTCKEKERKCVVYNSGTPETNSLSYIFSKDHVSLSGKSLNHKVPFKNFVNQNEPYSVLLTPWAHVKKVENEEIYKRSLSVDPVLKKHEYFAVQYVEKSGDRNFEVSRTDKEDFLEREDEIVTLRGQVPGENVDWSLSYVNNGVRYGIESGTQKQSYKDNPYQFLAYKNVNELQGNTSFFLTYKGTGGATYYRQLDVHMGELIKANEPGHATSMYGNVSVVFPMGAWENDVDVTVRTIDNDLLFETFDGLAPIGPIVEVLPSHEFPKGSYPTVSMTIPVKSLKDANLSPTDVKLYKPDYAQKKLVSLETQVSTYYDEYMNPCNVSEKECVYVQLTAVTPTFSTFFLMDFQNASKVEPKVPELEEVDGLSCEEMKRDILWMGTDNGWLAYPYPCKGKSNYLIQLSTTDNIAVEHQGASAETIIWNVRNSDLQVLDSSYNSMAIYYGLDGSVIQKIGPVVKLDSIAPEIKEVDVSVVDVEDKKKIHVEAEITEVGSGLEPITMEVFFAGNMLESRTIPGDGILAQDFVISKKQLFECVGCKVSVAVIARDKGHNSDKVVKQSEKIYPYPNSLVLWYPMVEGTGSIAYELMTKENSHPMNMSLSGVKNPWNGKYGVNLYQKTDAATSSYKLGILDSLRPFSFEFNFNAGYGKQKYEAAILSFVGRNGWTFGLGNESRYFIKVGSKSFYFKTIRDPNILTHLAVVVDGDKVSLYRNGNYVESIKLDNELMYGGDGKLSIGAYDANMHSVVGGISNLRFYSSALTDEQIRGIFNGVLSEEVVNIASVRAVTLTDREGLIVDQSCSAPGMSYLRQNSNDNSGYMTWLANVNSDNYSFYVFHRNYTSEESLVSITVNGIDVGTYKLESTGTWRSEKIKGLNLSLKSGINEISVRPFGNLGIVAFALASASANIDENQIGYDETSWANPEPKANVFMKYEAIEDKKWAQMRFDLRSMTSQNLENARIRYYYKGEGDNVNAVSFFPGAPLKVVNDAGSVYYAEFALTEAIKAYGTVYDGQGPLLALHRMESPNNFFPYWDLTDDPSYQAEALNGYVKMTGVALLGEDGNLLNEFACYDEDGPLQKMKANVRVMAKDNENGSKRSSNIAMYVENLGHVAVNGFEVRYYFRDKVQSQVDIYSNQFAENSKVGAGGDLYYVSFLYDITLNYGDKSDFGSGVQFEIHHENYTEDFVASDDPSHYRLNSSEFVEADSIVVLDRLGNLLWGSVPQPRFASEYVIKNFYVDLVHREGDEILANIEEKGYYILEIVNAAGIPQKTLYKGTWDEGEHSVVVDVKAFKNNSYVVLRRGSEILSWTMLN